MDKDHTSPAELKFRALKEATGIYTARDSRQFVEVTMLPAIDELLKHDGRARLRGTGYYISRSAEVRGKDGCNTYYAVLIEGRGAEWETEITILEQNSLTDEELIAHWPAVVASGLAADLLDDSLSGDPDTAIYDHEDVVSGSFPDALLAHAQQDALEEGDDTSIQERIYQQNILFYVDRTLYITSGKPPRQELTFGYYYDDTCYPVGHNDEDTQQLVLVGDTPAELEAMSKIKRVCEREIDETHLQEFVNALVILGIMKRSRRRR